MENDGTLRKLPISDETRVWIREDSGDEATATSRLLAEAISEVINGRAFIVRHGSVIYDAKR